MNESAAHRIRLPAPWKLASSSAPNPREDGGQITTHEFQRNFQRPSGLTESSRVELEIQILDDDNHGLPKVACLLNEHVIDITEIASGVSRGPMQLEILQAINRLTIRLIWLGDRPAVLPRVAILIS